MKKFALPLLVIFTSLSLMSFKSTKSFEQEMVDLKNYSINHKEVYSYILALKADPNSLEDQAKYCKLFKWAWRNSCAVVVTEVVSYFAGGKSIPATDATELEALGIIKKL